VFGTALGCRAAVLDGPSRFIKRCASWRARRPRRRDPLKGSRRWRPRRAGMNNLARKRPVDATPRSDHALATTCSERSSSFARTRPVDATPRSDHALATTCSERSSSFARKRPVDATPRSDHALAATCSERSSSFARTRTASRIGRSGGGALVCRWTARGLCGLARMNSLGERKVRAPMIAAWVAPPKTRRARARLRPAGAVQSGHRLAQASQTGASHRAVAQFLGGSVTARDRSCAEWRLRTGER
jgi:hypothetical protein